MENNDRAEAVISRPASLRPAPRSISMPTSARPYCGDIDNLAPADREAMLLSSQEREKKNQYNKKTIQYLHDDGLNSEFTGNPSEFICQGFRVNKD